MKRGRLSARFIGVSNSLLGRISPSVRDVVRALYLGVVRYDEVRAFLDSRQAALEAERHHAHAWVASRTVDLIGASSSEGRIAWIGAMPPARTGIGRFNELVTRNLGRPVDVFANYDDIAVLTLIEERVRNEASATRHLDQRFLDAARLRLRYRALVFCLGNSSDMLFVLQRMSSSLAIRHDERRILHVHDPVSWNLVWQSLGRDHARLKDVVMRHYGEFASELCGDNRPVQDITDDLVSHGHLGLRIAVANGRLDEIWVNSSAAEELILHELGTTGMPPVRRVFHPVFEPTDQATGPETPSTAVLRIGTFGVASINKQPELVLSACQILRSRGVDCRLVMAGYHVKDLALARGWSDRIPWLEVHDSPDDARLEQLMRGVDVAVQLRHLNAGESSGVVNQLIALGRPTVASHVGAFREFVDAVAFVGPNAGADEIAATILRARDDEALPARMQDFRERYGLAAFRDRVCHLISASPSEC